MPCEETRLVRTGCALESPDAHHMRLKLVSFLRRMNHHAVSHFQVLERCGRIVLGEFGVRHDDNRCGCLFSPSLAVVSTVIEFSEILVTTPITCSSLPWASAPAVTSAIANSNASVRFIAFLLGNVNAVPCCLFRG